MWRGQNACRRLFVVVRGKAGVENRGSCHCECHALIRLLRSKANDWYIAEYREEHNRLDWKT